MFRQPKGQAPFFRSDKASTRLEQTVLNDNRIASSAVGSNVVPAWHDHLMHAQEVAVLRLDGLIDDLVPAVLGVVAGVFDEGFVLPLVGVVPRPMGGFSCPTPTSAPGPKLTEQSGADDQDEKEGRERVGPDLVDEEFRAGL